MTIAINGRPYGVPRDARPSHSPSSPASTAGPDPRHGERRREHPPAHTLRLLPRRGGIALQRAPAKRGVRRDRRVRGRGILGVSESCIATHPSDTCVALAALDAQEHLAGPAGRRVAPLTELHRLPGDRPDIEAVLAPGELVTAGELPPAPAAARSTYRKVRDRASHAFALVSVAAVLQVADGTRSRAPAAPSASPAG